MFFGGAEGAAAGGSVIFDFCKTHFLSWFCLGFVDLTEKLSSYGDLSELIRNLSSMKYDYHLYLDQLALNTS